MRIIALIDDAKVSSLAALGYGGEEIPVREYSARLYEDGVVAITPGESQYPVLEPQVGEQDIDWRRYGQNASPAHLPATCRG